MSTRPPKGVKGIARLLVPFAWRKVARIGPNVYLQNRLTGERTVQRRGGWFAPVNWEWVDGKTDVLNAND